MCYTVVSTHAMCYLHHAPCTSCMLQMIQPVSDVICHHCVGAQEDCRFLDGVTGHPFCFWFSAQLQELQESSARFHRLQRLPI